MRIIVSDSGTLIDLRKASLLETFLRLPYEFLIPNTLFEEELLKFTAAQKRSLVASGLQVVDLSGKEVLRAQNVVRQHPRLSVHDGFAFVLAESNPGCILLTGDSELRALAVRHEMEVHGVLWVLDEIHRNDLAAASTLLAVLRALAADPAVRLPRRELSVYVKRFEKLK
jgi:predicted nucleic acid-binding protein